MYAPSDTVLLFNMQHTLAWLIHGLVMFHQSSVTDKIKTQTSIECTTMVCRSRNTIFMRVIPSNILCLKLLIRHYGNILLHWQAKYTQYCQLSVKYVRQFGASRGSSCPSDPEV